MYRFLLAAVPLLLVSVQVPGSADARNSPKTGKKCQQKKKGGFMRGIAGSMAGVGLGRVGVPSGIGGLPIPVHSLITDAIASRLDCKEQEQAANATTTATRGGVGTTASWESETRQDVSGSSTVVAQNGRSDGASCMIVNDVIIVNGEEVTASKQMCRAPGETGYTLAA